MKTDVPAGETRVFARNIRVILFSQPTEIYHYTATLYLVADFPLRVHL